MLISKMQLVAEWTKLTLAGTSRRRGRQTGAVTTVAALESRVLLDGVGGTNIPTLTLTNPNLVFPNPEPWVPLVPSPPITVPTIPNLPPLINPNTVFPGSGFNEPWAPLTPPPNLNNMGDFPPDYPPIYNPPINNFVIPPTPNPLEPFLPDNGTFEIDSTLKWKLYLEWEALRFGVTSPTL